VPLDESAIRAIHNSIMALDVYCWLAYRLHALTAPKAITWAGSLGQVSSYGSTSSQPSPRVWRWPMRCIAMPASR
jgi:hypothetical protein